MAVNEHERHSIIICRLKLNERNDAFIPFLLYSLIDILHFAIFIQLWEIYTFFLQCIVMKIKFKYCWSTFLPISTKRTITSGFKLIAHINEDHGIHVYFVSDGWWFMFLNATFNNILVISWQLVLLLEEIGVPGENLRDVASHWQTLSHNVVSKRSRHKRGSNSQL
jgi:hypothetical protein